MTLWLSTSTCDSGINSDLPLEWLGDLVTVHVQKPVIADVGRGKLKAQQEVLLSILQWQLILYVMTLTIDRLGHFLIYCELRKISDHPWKYLCLPVSKRVLKSTVTGNLIGLKLGWLVGCIEDLRRFQRYFSYIATWQQEITNLWKFKWRGQESNPGPLAPQAQELNPLGHRCSSVYSNQSTIQRKG